jgi:hypothetical protein
MLAACGLASCTGVAPARAAHLVVPIRYGTSGRVEELLGRVVEVEGIAWDIDDGAFVGGGRGYGFRVGGMSRWPADVEGKRVLVTGRLISDPGRAADEDTGFPRRPFGLERARWKILEPAAVEDGKAVFRLSSQVQFDAHRGNRVEVEGIAEPHKDSAYLSAPALFCTFQMNDLLSWPAGVDGKRVLVTGRLVLNPGLPAEELRAIEEKVGLVQSRGPHPPEYALDEVRWKVVGPD